MAACKDIDDSDTRQQIDAIKQVAEQKCRIIFDPKQASTLFGTNFASATSRLSHRVLGGDLYLDQVLMA